MKGTEKQIAFAEDLMKKMNTELAAAAELLPDNRKAEFYE